MRVIVIQMIIEDLRMDEGPLEEEDNITTGVEGCQMEGITMIEVTLKEEDPLMMEDLLMMEDPIEMEEIQDALEDKDHQAHQDLLDP